MDKASFILWLGKVAPGLLLYAALIVAAAAMRRWRADPPRGKRP